ncbi:MAG: archaellin/type IV pilin N-terminal domain-containing protein [Candidatus Nanohaloarchaea archaeon]|nr:archaellin/type IV pilin N-terminal domain-containing protein [Candidatus Nanohaloarchaea archaeon]
MNRKGISPLVAAVLLIAFTLAVASILTAYVTTFTEESAQQLGNQTTQVTSCAYAGISIYDAVYDTANSDITVNVANTGTKDLSEITVVAFASDGSILGRGTLSDLNTGDVSSTTISTGQQPDRVRASSSDCPQKTDEESSITTA